MSSINSSERGSTLSTAYIHRHQRMLRSPELAALKPNAEIAQPWTIKGAVLSKSQSWDPSLVANELGTCIITNKLNMAPSLLSEKKEKKGCVIPDANF